MLTKLVLIVCAFLVVGCTTIVDTQITKDLQKAKIPMKITSSAFNNLEAIPSQYSCDGGQAPPPLTLHDVPAEAKSIVLIMDDPDIPAEIKSSRGIEVFDHWVLFNILPTTQEILETSGVVGSNSRGDAKYTPACPPPQYEPSRHRYFFKIYALDQMLPLTSGATKVQVQQAMEGHIIAQATLIGTFSRK